MATNPAAAISPRFSRMNLCTQLACLGLLNSKTKTFIILETVWGCIDLYVLDWEDKQHGISLRICFSLILFYFELLGGSRCLGAGGFDFINCLGSIG